MQTVTIKGNGRATMVGQPFPQGVGAPEDPIIQQVIARLDLTDKMVRHALKEFLDDRAKALQEEIKAADILCKVESDEAFEAVVQCLVAQINFNATQRRLKLASEKHEVAKRQVVQVINEYEDLDPSAEWSLNIHRLLLLKPSKNKEEEALPQVFEFAKAMGNGTAAVPLERIRAGEVPDDLKGMEEFLKDLADFLLEAKDEGHRRVIAICNDVQAAVEAAQDEGTAKPVQFLALLALKNAKKKGN